jgi:hypothetical protein
MMLSSTLHHCVSKLQTVASYLAISALFSFYLNEK